MDFQKYIDLFEQTHLTGFLGQFASFAGWLVLIFIITRLVRISINKTVQDNSLRYSLKKTVRFVSYIFALLVAISMFTGNMQYFTVAIGIISAGLAFALQEVILSIAGWISINTAGTFKPGDRIELAGVKGDVIDVGITKTTLMELGDWVSSDNYTGRIVQVSNGAIFREPVRNYSADFPFLWDEIDIPVTYTSDVGFASKKILEIANSYLGEYTSSSEEHWKNVVKKYLIENARLEPSISIQLTDNWININLRFIVDYSLRRITKHKLHQGILDELRQYPDKIQIASATFELVGVPPLKVQREANLQ